MTQPPTQSTYDVFISHASEDKDSLARPLYLALQSRGVSVWFDEASLELGDSLHQKIDEGLSRCRYGVVILSPRFLAKRWPLRELNGLVARETTSGEKAILPVWYDLDASTLVKYSPTLADRLAAHSEDGVSAIAAQIVAVLNKHNNRPSATYPALDETGLGAMARVGVGAPGPNRVRQSKGYRRRIRLVGATAVSVGALVAAAAFVLRPKPSTVATSTSPPVSVVAPLPTMTNSTPPRMTPPQSTTVTGISSGSPPPATSTSRKRIDGSTARFHSCTTTLTQGTGLVWAPNGGCTGKVPTQRDFTLAKSRDFMFVPEGSNLTCKCVRSN